MRENMRVVVSVTMLGALVFPPAGCATSASSEVDAGDVVPASTAACGQNPVCSAARMGARIGFTVVTAPVWIPLVGLYEAGKRDWGTSGERPRDWRESASVMGQ